MSEIQIGGWSEEEYLLRHDKYISNTYSNNHNDLPGSSNDKDVYHERPKMMGSQKYLGKSCYHCIECTATTFLAAFMLRRPLNSVALSTRTHRKPERVFDGTSTQVKAQMINKCRIKMVQGEIYNVKDPHEVGIGEKRERTVQKSKLHLQCV